MARFGYGNAIGSAEFRGLPRSPRQGHLKKKKTHGARGFFSF
jgi:hypothetical protein